jgi:hypothetical protein
MTAETLFEPHDWHAFDSFQTEAEYFERDVHVLILDTLRAGVTLLNQEMQDEDAALKGHLGNADGHLAEIIGERQIDLWSTVGDQENFLRNMALVALLSRLAHALKQMARAAETFQPIDQNRSEDGKDEFKQIWAEYRARFGIDFSPRFIQFIDPLRRARNMIVHNGGEANLPISIMEIDLSKGDEGFYDPSFMKKYPQFVDGTGSGAKIVVSEEQLNSTVDASVKLVKHAAQRLREKELEAVKKERLNPKG